MKNLKRALSFALASVMLVGMMVVGASAGFTDDDKIVNSDAVNTMVALGVVKGKDTGAFDPTGIVTRAEMAKMICVAKNGKDVAMAGGGLYPDTKGHWAVGYIDYCTNMGIVAGDNKGNFNPDATVTGTEAAKMILISLGYNAETENFVNDAAWSININVRATEKGLYEDVSSIGSEGLTRDNAAQMLYNGMQAAMVKYTMAGIVGGNAVMQAEDIYNGNVAKTILNDIFKVETGYAYMTAVKYDSKKEEYTYTLNKTAQFGSDKIEGDEAVSGNYTTAKDYSNLFGMQVKMLYKIANGKTTVYGMYAHDSEVLATDIVGNIGTMKTKDDSVEIDGVDFDLTETVDTIGIYNYNKDTEVEKLLGNKQSNSYKFDLIDNDGDGEGDVIVVYPITVAKVTFVGKDSITVDGKTYKFEDATIYEGVKKNDWAIVTKAEFTKDQTDAIAKAEIVTGTVEALRGATKVKVGGVWYEDAVAGVLKTCELGDTVELVVVNGYAYNAKKTTATVSSDKALLVIETKDEVNYGTQEAKVLFADGTKKVINIAERTKTEGGKLEDVAKASNVVANGEMYTYTVTKGGEYQVSKVVADDYDAAAVNVAVTELKDGKAKTANGIYRFQSDAVVFVIDGTDYKAVTGADVNKWAKNEATVSYLYANETNGFNYVTLGLMTVKNSVKDDGDTSYGWVTKTSSQVKVGDNYYVEMTIWNGTEEVTVLADESSSKVDDKQDQYKKGTPISYTDLGDKKIETVTKLDTLDAVIGYNDGKDIDLKKAGTAKIDNDTVILYVNTKDNEGVEGASITVADQDKDDKYIENVYAYADGDGILTYIIVDTNNDVHGVGFGD